MSLDLVMAPRIGTASPITASPATSPQALGGELAHSISALLRWNSRILAFTGFSSLASSSSPCDSRADDSFRKPIVVSVSAEQMSLRWPSASVNLDVFTSMGSPLSSFEPGQIPDSIFCLIVSATREYS